MKRVLLLIALLALLCSSCATVGAVTLFSTWTNGVATYAVGKYDPNAQKKLKYNEWE